MLTNLKDKNIIITGGTSGLGLSVSKHFESKNNVLIVGNKNYSKVKKSKEVINSKEEGVEFIFNVSPVSIDDKGITLVKTQMSAADSSGRQSVQVIEGSEYSESADIIIFALGFEQELPPFLNDSGIELNKWNGISTNEQFQTSNSKVYSGGDSVRGADLAVRAAADGKNAAKEIVESFK